MAADVEQSIESLTWVRYLLTHNIDNEEVTPNNNPSGNELNIQQCVETIDIVIQDLTDLRDGR